MCSLHSGQWYRTAVTFPSSSRWVRNTDHSQVGFIQDQSWRRLQPTLADRETQQEAMGKRQSRGPVIGPQVPQRDGTLVYMTVRIWGAGKWWRTARWKRLSIINIHKAEQTRQGLCPHRRTGLTKVNQVDVFVLVGGREAEQWEARFRPLQSIPLEAVGMQPLQVEEGLPLLWNENYSRSKPDH